MSYSVSYSLTIYRHPCAHAFYYMKRKRKKERKYIHFRNLQSWYWIWTAYFFSNEHSSIINALDGTRKITLQFIYMFYTQTIFRLSTFIILKAETLTFFSLSIQLWLAVAEDGFSFENVGQTWYGLKSVPPPQFTVLYFEP